MIRRFLRNGAATITGLINETTGMGGAGDHSGATLSFGPDLNHTQIAHWMDREKLLRNAIEAKPAAIGRVWRKFNEGADDWVEADNALDIRQTCENALKFTATFGGAFVMPRFDASVVDNDALAEPFTQPRPGTLLGWRIFCPQELRRPMGWARSNENQPGTNLPMVYEIKDTAGGTPVRIHHSWVIPFEGALQYSRNKHKNAHDMSGSLGVSEVQLISDHLTRALGSLQQLSHMLAKANIDTLKSAGVSAHRETCDPGSPEMQQMLAEMAEDARAAVQGASNMQPVLLDVSESLERLGLSTGANAAVGMSAALMSAFVAATGVPRTIVLGEQSKGLNNGGEADLAIFHETCSAYRENKLTKPLRRIDQIVAADQGLTEPEWAYCPFDEMSEKERSEIEAKNAERDAKYLSAEIPFITSMVAERLQREKVYPFTDQDIAEIRATEGLTGRDG